MATKKRMKLPDATKVAYQPRPIDPGPDWPDGGFGGKWPKFPPRPGDPMPPWRLIHDLLDKKQILAMTKLDLEHQMNNKKLEVKAIENELAYLAKMKKAIGNFR